MDTPQPLAIPTRLHDLASLAGLLERLERQPSSASAGQYRDVVRQLTALLGDAEGAELDPLLRVAPATAEIYENLHYAHAGLCRSPLEAGLNAELEAAAAIRRARRPLG